MSRERLLRLTRGMGALLGLLALLVGLPAVLVVMAGWPLPHALPSMEALRQALQGGWSPEGMVVVKALAVVCWAAWAELAACAVVEVRGALRGGGQAPRVPLAGPLQPVVAHLVAAVVLSVSMAGSRPSSAGLPALASLVPGPSSVARQVSVVVQPVLYEAVPSPSASRIPPSTPPAKEVVVRPRDTLWGLADRHLGDPLRWREIWDRNRDRLQTDGRQLAEPQFIRPGWVLELPPDATGFEAAPAPAPVPASRDPSDHPRPPFPEVRSASGVEDSMAAAPQSAQAPSDGGSPGPSPGPSRGPEPPSAGPDLTPDTAPVSVALPSGSVVGMSFAAGIAAAVAAGRLRRRRWYRPSLPAPADLHVASDVGPITRAALRGVRRRGGTEDGTEEQAAPAEVPFAFAGLDDPQPARIAVGERSGAPVELDIGGAGGLALGGPGGPDVARAILVALLTKGGPQVVRVLIPRTTAAQLLPGLAPVPGLGVVEDLEAALSEVEVELVRRTRLLEREEVDDFTAHRAKFPDDPLPALVLVAGEAGQLVRLKAVASMGSGLGVGTVVVRAEPHGGAGIEVAADGTVASVVPGDLAAELEGASLYRLTAPEAIELLGVLAAARSDNPAREVAPVRGTRSDDPDGIETLPAPAGGTAVRVQLLGPCRIEVGGEEVKARLRRSARDLLGYFLLHPQGTTAEAATEALWPDADPARGPERFWTALGNLRSRLREATGTEHKFIDREGELYRVEAGIFDVDLWRFQGGLAEARWCPDDEAVADALETAVAEYRGYLLEGSYADWVEPIRESLRRQALDALARLSELRAAAGGREAALGALEQALGIDPFAEDLYRRGIRFLGQVDRVQAARRLFRQLEGRLAELDAEPEEETLQLMKELGL